MSTPDLIFNNEKVAPRCILSKKITLDIPLVYKTSIHALLVAMKVLVLMCFSTHINAKDKIVPVSCENNAKPVYMIVEGANENPKKFANYAKALRESKLYDNLQGYYSAFGDPVDVFEGEWQEKEFKVMARFPCLARAKQFWYSDVYEKLKPLRKGAGDVRVTVFEEMAKPNRITW